MKTHITTRITLALVVTALYGHDAQAQTFREAVQQRIAERQATRAEAKLSTGGSVQRDIAYGSDAAHKLDVYRPAAAVNDAKGAPLIVMVHGGAWITGDKAAAGVVNNKVAHWVAKGYVLVSINNRLVLMGHSAGAHLVALVSADPAFAARAGAHPWRGTVALDSAAFDVTKIMRDRHPGFYDRAFGADPAYWREASPLLRLKGKLTSPLLAVCSSQRSHSCAQAEVFAAHAASLGGARVQVLPVDLSHGEINDLLGTASAYTADVQAFIESLGLP